MKVDLIDSMGDDAAVVAAARVSYGKGTQRKRGDDVLIEYLVEHGHLSPLEQVVVKFRVEAPIYVARQWRTHRTQSWNERSARYTPFEEEFAPIDLRLQGGPTKQTSGAGRLPLEDEEYLLAWVDDVESTALALYGRLLKAGVAKEVARTVLPVSAMTAWYVTANLRNWLDFCRQRCHHHAQQEIRYLAHQVLDHLRTIAPVCVDVWERHVRDAQRFSRDEMAVLLAILGSPDEPKVGHLNARQFDRLMAHPLTKGILALRKP